MLEWTSEETALLCGVPVRRVTTDYASHPTTDETITVLKDRSYFRDYQRLNPHAERILEIGIFEGGSALLLAGMYPTARIAALDIREPNPAVLRHVERMDLSERLSLNYGVSQSDEEAVLGVMGQLGPRPPDLVIDDASHDYALTKRTFEIVFPRMERWSQYVIEDWGWAHWPNSPFNAWKGPTLSSLIFELVVGTASARKLIESVTVTSRYAVITRGEEPSGGTLDLDARLDFNGRRWVRLGEA